MKCKISNCSAEADKGGVLCFFCQEDMNDARMDNV